MKNMKSSHLQLADDDAIIYLIIINTICFLLPLDKTIPIFCYLPEDVFGFKYYIFLTYMFFHANRWHLLSNMTFVFFLGYFFITKTNHYQFFLVYIFGGYFAGFLDALSRVFTSTNLDSYTLGASGSIASLLGALLIYTVADDDCPTLKRIILVAINILIFAIIQGFKFPGNTVHLFAYLTGMILQLITMSAICFEGDKQAE